MQNDNKAHIVSNEADLLAKQHGNATQGSKMSSVNPNVHQILSTILDNVSALAAALNSEDPMHQSTSSVASSVKNKVQALFISEASRPPLRIFFPYMVGSIFDGWKYQLVIVGSILDGCKYHF